MSRDSSKELITMINIEYIDRVRWDSELGDRLKNLRGKTSRRKLADKTNELGRRVPQQYIQQLEQPNFSINRLKSNHLTVSLEVVQVLAQALDVELTEIFTKSAIVSQ